MNLVLGGLLLRLFRKRQSVEIVGIVVAISASTFAAVAEPLHVVIAGAGVTVALVGFVAFGALDPATRFVSFQPEADFGPAVSLSRLVVELIFVAGVTLASAAASAKEVKRRYTPADASKKSWCCLPI